MTLSTISVHLDHTECCEARTRLAVQLARLHGSHLMGIVPTWTTAAAGTAVRGGGRLDEAIVEASLYLRRRAETVAHVFRSRTRPATFSCDARLVDGDPVSAVVHHGRASDLIVVGQAEASAAVSDAARRLPEQVMLDAGRPVLIVPCGGGEGGGGGGGKGAAGGGFGLSSSRTLHSSRWHALARRSCAA